MIKFAIVRPTWAQSWSDKDSTRALQNVNFVLLYGQLSINQYTRQNYVNISVSLSAKVPGFLIYTDLNYFLYMLQSTSQKSMNIKGLKHNTIQSLSCCCFQSTSDRRSDISHGFVGTFSAKVQYFSHVQYKPCNIKIVMLVRASSTSSNFPHVRITISTQCCSLCIGLSAN